MAACLGACAASPPQTPAASPAATTDAPIRYACDDGGFLSVRFTAEGAEVIQVDGERATLPRRPGGSGFLYASERFALRGAGDVATWTDAGGRPATCQAT